MKIIDSLVSSWQTIVVDIYFFLTCKLKRSRWIEIGLACWHYSTSRGCKIVEPDSKERTCILEQRPEFHKCSACLKKYAHSRGYIFNNKDTSQPSFYRECARYYAASRKKKSTQHPALKLEPTPLQATASLRPLFRIFRLFDALSDGFPSFPKLFTVYNQHTRIITRKRKPLVTERKLHVKFCGELWDFNRDKILLSTSRRNNHVLSNKSSRFS